MALTSVAKGTPGKYELIILHPSRILTGGFPVVIKHPATGHLTTFYTSSDGFFHEGPLHEGSPTGPRLPAFGSRGGREVTLNPILVNHAAVIRLRRLERQLPEWRATLDEEAQKILTEVERLHEAVLWKPGQDFEQLINSVKLPLQALDLHSSAHCHQPPPPAPGEPAQPSPRPPGEPKGGFPTMSWEDAEKLIHHGNVLL